MKVLVDSCIWSLALRRRQGVEGLNKEERGLIGALADGIRDGLVVMVGPVRQEVLSGIRHVEQFERLREHLQAFRDEPIESEDYVHAAQLDHLCRKEGLQCGPVDMLLCALAQRRGWSVLTNDAGLLRCMKEIARHGEWAG
jgi:predicted nucleic acid-binding protein